MLEIIGLLKKWNVCFLNVPLKNFLAKILKNFLYIDETSQSDDDNEDDEVSSYWGSRSPDMESDPGHGKYEKNGSKKLKTHHKSGAVSDDELRLRKMRRKRRRQLYLFKPSFSSFLHY